MAYPQGFLFQPSVSLALHSCPSFSSGVILGPRTEELGRSSSGSAFAPYSGSATSPGFNSHLPYGGEPRAAATLNSFVSPGYDPSSGISGSLEYHPFGALGPYPYGDPTYRKNATRDATATLKAWLNEHRKNPYPTKGEKIMLAIITKMTLTQVSTWFANARRRLKKENKMTWTPRNRSEDEEEEDNIDLERNDDDDEPMKPSGDEPETKSEAERTAMPIEASLIRTLRTRGTRGRLTSWVPPPRGPLPKTHDPGGGQSVRARAHALSPPSKEYGTSTPAVPSRGPIRPPNPNCGRWLRSPPRRRKVKDVMTPRRAGAKGGSSNPGPPRPPTPLPRPGPRSLTAPPCPDTCTTPPPSSPDTPTLLRAPGAPARQPRLTLGLGDALKRITPDDAAASRGRRQRLQTARPRTEERRDERADLKELQTFGVCGIIRENNELSVYEFNFYFNIFIDPFPPHMKQAPSSRSLFVHNICSESRGSELQSPGGRGAPAGRASPRQLAWPHAPPESVRGMLGTPAAPTQTSERYRSWISDCTGPLKLQLSSLLGARPPAGLRVGPDQRCQHLRLLSRSWILKPGTCCKDSEPARPQDHKETGELRTEVTLALRSALSVRQQRPRLAAVSQRTFNV
ncbi:hypothetical protein L3Q82_007083 [Scortum barcoo]|uniref:Uncharacterized protein n=1 Tax=Scortum barcoo TaxID=214431 RepID=A0ACB8WS30_9TELE|nr:hypothetical protein L3Q82_007083 [Scortum barcoo]